MAHALTFPDSQLRNLAEHISRRPPHVAAHRLKSARPQPKQTLGENLNLWYLTNTGRLADSDRIEDLAHDSGMVHHQIQSKGRAYHFALSRLSEDGSERELVGVFHSRLAQRLHDAIRWIDANTHDDSEQARLLWLPEINVHAVWLLGDAASRLVVVNKPNMGAALTYGRLHEPQKFLASIARRRPSMVQHGERWPRNFRHPVR